MVTTLRGFAQRMDLTGGSVGISYTAAPSQQFKDTSGGTSYHAFGINLNVPLFGNRNKIKGNILQNEKPRFYEISGHAAYESYNSTIDFLKDQHTFYQASAGLSAVFFNGRKNIILADFNVGISADGPSIQGNNEKLRYSGLFIVNHIQNPSLTWQYGIVVSYAYGRPLPLPVLGIRKKFSSTWTFSAILPVSVQFTDKLNKNMNISFLLRPSGNRFQFDNINTFNSPSYTLYMQLRQFELGINYQYRLAKQFSIGAEAGLLVGGKLKFTEMDDIKSVVYQTGIKPGAKFRLSLRYRFPHKKAGANYGDMEGDILRMN